MVDWKKDYKTSDLFKRDKASKDEAATAAEPESAADEPAPSLLKKEIHLFGGKSKAPKEPKPAKAPRTEGADVPWYKKEVSLRKGKAAAPAPQEPAEPSVPWYKKEVSLKQKPAPKPLPESPPLPLVSQAPVQLPPVELPIDEPEPEAVPVADVLPEREPVAEPLPEPLVELRPEPEPVMHALPELEPEPQSEPEPLVHIVPQPEPQPALPEPVAEAAPGPARPVSWIDAVLEARDPEPLPEPAFAPAAPAVEPEATVQPPEPVAELPAPEPEPVAVAEAERLVAAETEPREIHPPVTAAELRPLEADEERPSVPWYKREVSLGRKPREKEPFELDVATVPFWKKKLSLGRGAKPEAEAEPVASAAAAKPAPFWKKELSFGRRVKQPAAALEPVALETETLPAAEKSVPFWKKNLSLGRGAEVKAPTASKEPTAEQPRREKHTSEPFWKKGISMPSLSLPQRSGGGSVPKELVGLKIGASQLAAARVANNGHAEVLQVARGPLDQGVIVGGELRDPDALAEALKEFFRRHKLPKKGVRLGIANNRIGVRTFEIGGIDDPKQLANAIRFRAQEALPIPIEEAVLDYQVLEDTVNEEGEQMRKILLVVAYRELVDRYVMACRKAGITLVGIDLEAFALLRALAAPREEAAGKAAVVAVAVGHDRSTFAVSDGRVCEFTRVLEWGGQNLNVAIARALDLTPSEAEPVKHVLSLEGGPTPEGVTDEQIAAARDAAVRQVNTFARELVSSLQFYQSQPGSLGIGEIILTGGTAHLVGFASELQRLIGVKVRIGDPLVRVKVPKRFQEPEQIGSLAIAIGLGIED
jgi:type IV pilus assembly protein PilM